MLAGKDYRAKGATTYTIVNEVALCADQLPREPTISEFGTLRSPKKGSDKSFTFCPNVVHAALEWLKVHNQLYHEVPGTMHNFNGLRLSSATYPTSKYRLKRKMESMKSSTIKLI
jgi:hypothetical protein